MKKMTWIIILVACGIGLAVLVGVLGTRNEPSTSKTEAVSSLCTSLKALDSSIKTLTGIDTSTATKADYQADVTAVQNAWSQVQTDAQAVQNAPTGSLDSAWDSFSSAVKNVPNDASVSDAVSAITSSAQALASAVESTEAQLSGCVPASSSTTTTTSSSTTTIAGPVVYYLVGGAKAKNELDELKGWLAVHNAAVMAVLFVVFGVDLIAKGIPALTS